MVRDNDFMQFLADNAMEEREQAFPFNGRLALDVIISADTSWTTADYPGRVVKLNKLTIEAGDTLTLEDGSPWFVFLDELEFGSATSVIQAKPPLAPLTGVLDLSYNRPGRCLQSNSTSVGGYGGPMLFLCVREVTGAAGLIKAAGGNGNTGDGTHAVDDSRGGEGALDTEWEETISIPTQVRQGVVGSVTQRFSTVDTTAATNHTNGLIPWRVRKLMVRSAGENTNNAARWGSSGGSSGKLGEGGSSWTSGGTSADPGFKGLNSRRLSLKEILLLIDFGITSGGGGASNTVANDIETGSGGGGGIAVVFVETDTETPVVTAPGGTKAGGTNESGDGGDGVAYLFKGGIFTN